MKERILLVGEDRILLETRALLLAEWSATIASTKEALATIEQEPFDIVIIGQLVPEPAITQLIIAARKSSSAPAMLVIRFPGEEKDFGVEVQTTDSWDNPGWLRASVARMISKRTPVQTLAS